MIIPAGNTTVPGEEEIVDLPETGICVPVSKIHDGPAFSGQDNALA